MHTDISVPVRVTKCRIYTHTAFWIGWNPFSVDPSPSVVVIVIL